MVSNKAGFTHIAVHDEEEDEVVIQAGAPSGGLEVDSQADTSGDGDSQVDAPEVDDSQAECSHADASAQAEVEPGEPTSSASVREEPLNSLDDLQGFKMGAVQKAVIAVAVIGLIAFAIYYTFFM